MPVPAIRVVKVDIQRVVSAVLKDKQKVEDLRPLWEFVWEDFIIGEVKKVFSTNGFGEWQRRKDNLPHPLLRKSYRLYRSYTQDRIKENINKRGKDSYTFGSSTPYATHHERGVESRNLPARPVIGLVLRNLRDTGGARRLTEAFESFFDSRGFSLSARRRDQLAGRLRRQQLASHGFSVRRYESLTSAARRRTPLTRSPAQRFFLRGIG